MLAQQPSAVAIGALGGCYRRCWGQGGVKSTQNWHVLYYWSIAASVSARGVILALGFCLVLRVNGRFATDRALRPALVRSRQLRACRRTVEQVPRQPPSYQISLRLQSFACTTCERAARKRHQGIVPTARRYGRIRTELPGPLIATCRATWTGGLASAVAELRGARHRSKGHSHSLHSPAIPGQLLPESCNICTCKREPTERTS